MRIVRQETGTTDIAACLVDFDVVDLQDILGYGIEVVIMRILGEVNGDNPFETITRGAEEHQLSVEVFVKKQVLAQALGVGQVVEIDAHQA